MKFASLLTPDAVFVRLNAQDKKHALKLLSAEAEKLTKLDAREIYSALLEREQIGCTGMGSGVCIPHARFEDLRKPYALFARLDHRIEFGAADGKPVDLIFLLLTPAKANTEHLKALAIISRLLRDKLLVENIRATDDAAVVHSLLSVAADEDAA